MAIVVTDSVWTLATDPRADPRLVALLAQLGAADPPPAPPFTRASPREDVLAWFAGVEPRAEELFAAVSAPEVGGVTVETTRILGPDGNEIPLFVHRPQRAAGRLPCVVHLHCCAAVVVGYAIEAIANSSDLAYSELFLMCLVWTAAMCLWQARNREQQHAELESQRDELARVSRADPLTDALNRRGFQERLELELAEARRSARPLTLAVIDLDGFKDVNDRDGHAAGDQLLRQTVHLVREVLRPMDAVGRLGGDEFALLLTGAGEADAGIVIGHVRGALATTVPASIGHACFPGDGVTAQQLLDEADRRLYIAKRLRARKRGDARVELSWATALADAVDRRMNGQHHHSRAVADNACAIASRLGWTEPRLARLRLAATLHDVGKVAIPDRILNKPTALTADEYAEIKQHVTVGADILSRIDDLDEIVPWVRHCHEHLDGSGYPDGLTGHQIPAASRILLAADAFDAMTSDRSYRRALHPDEAADELRRHAGTQFDPDCVTALIQSLALSGHAPARAA